jgi:serine/threonine-protein kinase HipA
LLTSNYDDHLRNHGFLMHQPSRWSISPAYDINPVPAIDRARVNKMPISEDNEGPSIEGALAVAPRFGLKASEAKAILREAVKATSAWKKTGRKLGLTPSTLAVYASAFENDLTAEARRFLRL